MSACEHLPRLDGLTCHSCTWMEAVWRSELKPLERLVAFIYADHAWGEHTAWVTLDRLCQCTSLGRTQAKKWRGDLVRAGWLVEVEKARQHGATVYALVVPDAGVMSSPRTLE